VLNFELEGSTVGNKSCGLRLPSLRTGWLDHRMAETETALTPSYLLRI